MLTDEQIEKLEALEGFVEFCAMPNINNAIKELKLAIVVLGGENKKLAKVVDKLESIKAEIGPTQQT